jgi:glycosyltransferase involved in cell wall biosynthesis
MAKTILVLGSYAPSLVRFRGSLLAAMAERGHKVIAAAPNITSETRAAIEMLGAEPLELQLVNASLNPMGMLSSLRQLRRIVRERRPDVLVSYTIKPVILAAIAGKAERVPKIVSLITGVGYAFTAGRELKRLVSRAMASVLYRIALSRSDEIIFQNPDDEALFRKLRLIGVNRQSRLVNGSGIDLDHFSPVPLPLAPSFLMIARLLKDKGIREFAEAAKRLKREHPDVPIALVGRLDPSPDSLAPRELDALAGCGIDFKGELADVRPAIADCSVYVLPSYREGTPRSVLEAMAMGRAIVTTDAPGCRQTVVDGENGILVRPRDVNSLYEALSRFVHEPDLARRMGPASRRIAEQRFDVNAVNARLLDYAGL